MWQYKLIKGNVGEVEQKLNDFAKEIVFNVSSMCNDGLNIVVLIEYRRNQPKTDFKENIVRKG